ncbi:ABC transporter permease [Mammaliicoccus lentus]|uniref:ABC transporter permease n=1 Tax=Mammaliicoccus lentus TaxID=42858 RepID=UPI001072CC3C|nr:ABC transporter permease [Mammaliicoccus lentus]MBF0794688.1 ABC transporter permease [Mammaliicoccus lentus]TFV15632.1 ABC transporter permease [Mammaliicoccus lentus]
MIREQYAFFKIELRSLLREPVSIFFMIVLPIILTIVFGGAFGDEATKYGKHVLGIDAVVPVNIVFLLANAGLMGIPITVLELREQGVLKRYSTYPVNLRTYFISLVFTFSLISVLSTLLFLSLSIVVYHASIYMNFIDLLIFMFIYVMIIYIFYSIGFLVALFIKSARTANLVSSGFFMAMLFTSGVVLPLDSLPSYVQVVAKIFPMSHSIEVMQMIWIGQFSWGEYSNQMLYLFALSILLFIVLRNVKLKWDM